MAAIRYVGLGKETTYGTAVAATRYIETIADVKPDQNWRIPKPVAYRAFQKKYLGAYRARGTLGDFAVEPENIGELLLGVLGSVSSAPAGATSYLHTFTPADTIPSFTARIGSEQTERVLPGGLVESLKVTFPFNNALQANSELLSGFIETKAALGTPAFSALDGLDMREATSLLTIGGADKRSTVYDLEVSIKNNVPFDKGSLAAGRSFARKLVGMREVTGKLGAYFDDTTEYDRFIAGNEFTLIVQADGPLIETTYRYYLAFELHRCVYKGGTPALKSWDEPLVIDAPFQAFYDTTGAFNAEIKAKLQNKIASY